MSIDDDALATPADAQDGPAVPESREPAAIAGKPSDEELLAAYWKGIREAPMCGATDSWVAGLRAVARLCLPAAPPAPAVVPIPVSERWPGPEDCDDQKRCWWLVLHQSWPCLYLMKADALAVAVVSHWLPAHAIPLPAPQGGEVEA